MFLSRLTVRKLLAVIAIVAVAGSLAVWTVTSPVVMQQQSEEMLSTSIFQYARETRNFTFVDGSGAFLFHFGLAYNANVIPGQPMIVVVYASLVGQNITSAFTRGVSIQLQHATLLVDGTTDSGVKVRSTYTPQVASFYLSYISINASAGVHLITIRLILNSVDVNYIGYLTGSTQLVELNATVALE